MEKNSLSYQVLKKRYNDLKDKNKELQREIDKRDRSIDGLKEKIKLLNNEIEERGKKIKEKNIIIGALLSKKNI